MAKKANLQDLILAKFQEKHQLVTVFVTNGFQIKGHITGFDQFTVVLEAEGTQSMVYKSAISTIQPTQPINLDALREEEPQGWK